MWSVNGNGIEALSSEALQLRQLNFFGNTQTMQNYNCRMVILIAGAQSFEIKAGKLKSSLISHRSLLKTQLQPHQDISRLRDV